MGSSELKRAPASRRMGPENAATRLALMDATEAVMREEGYAALSSRRVAERAGVNQQTVYYYFQTMEDLLLAAYRRRTQRVYEKLEQAMASERPLHAFWHALADPFDAALSMEYLALANHNEPIRRETIEFGERLRRMQVDKVVQGGQPAAQSDEAITPVAIVVVITYIGHLLGFEATLGIRGGHKETRALMEWCLRRLEPVGG
jgi:AcrR family transcriptional regulator